MRHHCKLSDFHPGDDSDLEKALPALGMEHNFEQAAVTVCVEDDEGRFFVGNGEYACQVNHCPFCGKRAENRLKRKKPVPIFTIDE